MDGWEPLLFGIGGTATSAAAIWFGAGRFIQKLEDRIEACEKQLKDGSTPLKEVPVLVEKFCNIQQAIVPVKEVPVLVAKLDAIQADVRDIRARMVTRTECDARHEKK